MDDDLGACLRAWRDRLPPDEIGLRAGGRRRAPGLRRQEVAELAGLSVEYLARLEQGRAARPSAAVLGPLARALRLSDAERDHLLALAGHAPGSSRVSPHMTPGIMRILDRLDGTPVHVSDDRYTVVHANRLAIAVLGDDLVGTNYARTMFLGGGLRIRDDDGHHDDFRTRIVAELRRSLTTSPRSAAVRELVDELLDASPDFAERWARAEVGGTGSRRKVVDHPEVGRFTVDCDVLHVEDSSLKLIVYTAQHGTPDADALALLSTIGSQRFSG
ncbi:helix-turn-helix transcriptional regulator [Patulibacter minatonensis]|uniref:helix-turn-helix transcriptional regulator n=1 Tax=Patulibacter minatonensis TaxID=298163 RepID=UPI00047E5B5F|nr:helix-turn-helix transcriptional regulator [Patulibacter minatonensis]